MYTKSNKLKTLPTLQNGLPSLSDVYKLVYSRKSEDQFYELEAAEVVDILLTEENLPTFDDGTPNFSLIGTIKARMINSQQGLDEDELTWIFPLDTNLKEYPVKGEYVIVVDYLGVLFYTQKLNILGSVNSNSAPGISNIYGDNSEFQIGEAFEVNTDIRQLQPYEGDIIFNGRFGHGIRFGKNEETLRPNIKISVGHDTFEETLHKPVMEDININGSSIWILSDEQLSSDFTYGREIPIWEREWTENQIVINSDRLIFNTKNNGDIGLFSNNSVIIGGTTNVVIDSPEIKLGSDDAEEPLVLGEQLKGLLEELIDAITKMTVPTGVGPSGVPVNAAQFGVIKKKLNNMLSKQNLTV